MYGEFLSCAASTSMLQWLWWAPPTCPSFCMSVHRSSTSEPHWPAACTQACAYSPATELWRLREHPGKDMKKHSWYLLALSAQMVCVSATFQNALLLPGCLVKRRRGDEDHSVCWNSGWSQKPGDLLQVLWVLLNRDVLLGVFICRAGADEKRQNHTETLEKGDPLLLIIFLGCFQWFTLNHPKWWRAGTCVACLYVFKKKSTRPIKERYIYIYIQNGSGADSVKADEQ